MSIYIDRYMVECVMLQLQRSHEGCAIHITQFITLERENGWLIVYDREPLGQRAEGLDDKTVQRVAYVRPNWRTGDVVVFNDIITEV